jgi:polysaccharide biosynthesis/export protein
MRGMLSRLHPVLVRTSLALALLGAASGCGSSGRYVWVNERPPDPANASGRTLIGAGDVVEVQVYGDEHMSTRGRVLGDGTLTVPVLGPVYVAGKRSEELAASLEEQLKRYVNVPKVTVIIQESVVSVAAIGEVRTPGVVELVAPATVLQALAKAGGMTEFADSSGIFVLRKKGDQTERIRFKYAALVQAEPAATSFRLKTGDVLVVE